MDQDQAKERLAEWSALVGGLAHEIKNPLSTMNLNLQLLREDWERDSSPLGQRSVKKVEVMLQECSRLESMLSEFLRLTSPSDLELQPCDIHDILDDVVDFLQHEVRNRNAAISVHYDRDLPALELDSNLMRQVLLNLLKNALDALEGSGDSITVQTQKVGDKAMVEIIDNGVGMSPRVVEQIFNLYFSTKSAGTGLGLPMVKRIVERHGGRVVCDSQPEAGTRFRIELPLRSGEESSC